MVRKIGIGIVALLVAIQLVPYGREHGNPKVTGVPTWDSPETKALAERACFNCHSNQTEWPFYTWIAPFSWLAQHDVDEGREKMNFSEWDKGFDDADESAELVEEGEMPPWFYLPLHPEAQLNAADKAKLIAGLKKSFPEKEGGEGKPGAGGDAH